MNDRAESQLSFRIGSSIEVQRPVICHLPIEDGACNAINYEAISSDPPFISDLLHRHSPQCLLGSKRLGIEGPETHGSVFGWLVKPGMPWRIVGVP